MHISVVIPAYNEEKYIGACLKSLMKQTRKPFEIIVVDNNSTDKTVEIAQKFSNVRVITEKQQGITPARNRGFNEVRGDIIARTDADTLVPTNWIERIEDIFINKHIDAASGPSFYYDTPVKSDSAVVFFFWMSKVLFGHPILIGPNAALLFSVWQKVKKSLCLEDRKVHEDIDLAIHIARMGGIILYDPKLTVHSSARRILRRPESFFIEYTIRYIRMLVSHAFK